MKLPIKCRQTDDSPPSKPLVPPDRLLCEMVHERHALATWENEGGATAKQNSWTYAA